MYRSVMTSLLSYVHVHVYTISEEVGHVIDLLIEGTFLMMSVGIVVLVRKL